MEETRTNAPEKWRVCPFLVSKQAEPFLVPLTRALAIRVLLQSLKDQDLC